MYVHEEEEWRTGFDVQFVGWHAGVADRGKKRSESLSCMKMWQRKVNCCGRRQRARKTTRRTR
jgi:hypothetical protein